MSQLQPIVVEQDYGVCKKTLWKAITDHKHMLNWFFDNIPEFKPEVGFETQFNVNSGERDFLHLWKITEVVPEQKIVYDWRYRDLPGEGKVTFEVFEEGDGSAGPDNLPAANSSRMGLIKQHQPPKLHALVCGSCGSPSTPPQQQPRANRQQSHA